MNFNFEGTYTSISEHQFIESKIDDDRRVKITFEKTDKGVAVVETFDVTSERPAEMHRQG